MPCILTGPFFLLLNVLMSDVLYPFLNKVFLIVCLKEKGMGFLLEKVRSSTYMVAVIPISLLVCMRDSNISMFARNARSVLQDAPVIKWFLQKPFSVISFLTSWFA